MASAPAEGALDTSIASQAIKPALVPEDAAHAVAFFASDDDGPRCCSVGMAGRHGGDRDSAAAVGDRQRAHDPEKRSLAHHIGEERLVRRHPLPVRGDEDDPAETAFDHPRNKRLGKPERLFRQRSRSRSWSVIGSR